jgi:hypothetical protein
MNTETTLALDVGIILSKKKMNKHMATLLALVYFILALWYMAEKY